MLISVNICLYNSIEYIKETLDSVFNQTYQNFEIIALDDGSADGTFEYIQKNWSDPRLKVFQQENRGLGYSRNRCIELSSGDYIAFLDHDDVWLPDKLQLQITAAEKMAELPHIIFGDFEIIDSHGKPVYGKGEVVRKNWLCTNDLFETLLINCKNIISLSSAMALRRVFEEGITFPDLKVAEEFEVWMRVAHGSPAFAFVPDVICRYRVHDKNATLRFAEDGYREKMEILAEWCKAPNPKHLGLLKKNLQLSRLEYGHWARMNAKRPLALTLMKRAVQTSPLSPRCWWGYIRAFFEK